jgi:hypothetical protein
MGWLCQDSIRVQNTTRFVRNSRATIGFSMCIGMPMAVGYSAAQVNASDFPQPPSHSCFVQLFDPVAEYVTGMNVTYVNALQP